MRLHDVVIATRGSALALAQANAVADILRATDPRRGVHIEVIRTKGDEVLDVALSKIGDKGLFVTEIETALLAGRVDLAVHSAKDLPSQLPDGLCIAAVLPRGDERDALVVPAATLSAPARAQVSPMDRWLRPGSCVGTSSLRRTSQLIALRPDLVVQDIRGNVDTRLRKLAHGRYDALILAAAGLERLGLTERVADGMPTPVRDHALVAIPLSPSLMLPAAGQGALALEARASDAQLRELLRRIDDAAAHAELLAERALLARLEGGCQTPIASYATLDGATLTLSGYIGAIDGSWHVRGASSGGQADAERIGSALAVELLSSRDARALIAGRDQDRARRPLEGRRVMITRAEARATTLATRLSALGATPILCPVLAHALPDDIGPFDAAMRSLMMGGYDWVVFTSVTAATFVQRWMHHQGHATWPRTRIAAVGPATASACQQALGTEVACVPERFDGAALAAALNDLHGQRVLLPGADLAGPRMCDALIAAGARVDAVIVYRTVPAPEGAIDPDHLLRTRGLDAITFTSGSAVRFLVQRLGADALAALRDIRLICLGGSAVEALAEVGLRADAVAQTATEAGLVDAVIACFSATTTASDDNQQGFA